VKEIGDIHVFPKQQDEGRGAKIIDRQFHDFKDAFPEMGGFLPRSLKYMWALADAW